MSEKIRRFVLEALRESGLTQEQAAEKANMTRSQLNGYLLGKREMRTDTVHRLLLSLGYDLELVKRKIGK